jgi:hypothetical protein
MAAVGQGFTRAEIAIIERFVEVVMKRERQVAASTGIAGSFAKALFDTMRDLRMQNVRLEHKERAESQAPR